MNNEEKKAIEIIKEFKKTGFITLQHKYNKDRFHCRIMIENTIDTILNLIEKQQKEIEDLKEKNNELRNTVVKSVYMVGALDERSQWYQKIKKEIKELDNMKVDGEVFTTAVNFAKKTLKELIGKEE